MFQMLNIKYFGTQLYGRQVATLDGGLYITPLWAHLSFGDYKIHPDYVMKYFTKDSPHYKLNEFLYGEDNHEEGYARRRFFEIVLLFEDFLFLNTSITTKRIFLKDRQPWTVSGIEANTQRQQEQVVIRLKMGKVLNQMLTEFRQISK